jgi:Zn-dependent protease
MLLLEPERTPYDLRWRMFGIDVRVHPMFWLFSALLGWVWYQIGGGGSRGLALVAMWVLAVFISVLIHELGHVVAGRCFGAWGNIVLYSFGGLAVGASNLPYRWQRVVVSLAGPGAQFLLLGVLYLLVNVLQVLGPPTDPFEEVFRLRSDPIYAGYRMLWWVNLIWPIFNLLPIIPLDGGKVTQELCEAASPVSGRRIALVVSMIVAVVLALHILVAPQGIHLIRWIPLAWTPGPLTAIFLFLFAMENFQMLQEENSNRRNWDDDRFPWER